MPPGVEQYFVLGAGAGAGVGAGAGARYRPVVLGAARVGFGDAKLGIDEVRDVVYAAPFGTGAVAVDWATAAPVDVATADLKDAAPAGASFEDVPAAGLQAKSYAAWNKEFGKWLSQSEKLELFRQRDLKLTSNPGESERDFQIRVQDAQRAARDAAVDALNKKYASKRQQIEEQKRRAAASVDRESAQASQQKLQTGLSVGATILGALFGRTASGVGSLGRATTAARGVGRSMKETDEERARALDEEIRQETLTIAEQFSGASAIERVSLAPKRGQVSVQLVGLGWLPEDRG